MIAVVLKCGPGSRFHFGKYAPDADTALNDSDEIMHSDTLFSAIVNSYQDLFGNADELVDAFRNGLIKISSVNYCIRQAGNYVWFLPKPVFFNLVESDNNKNFKSINYISKKIWEQIDHPLELVDDERIIQVGKGFLLYSDELTYDTELVTEYGKNTARDGLTITEVVTLPKVQVRKETQADSLYQLSMTEIGDNTLVYGINNILIHLYFLVEINDSVEDELRKKVTNAIQLFEYTGIGAERATIGKIENVEIVQNWEVLCSCEISKEYECSISLLLPNENELSEIILCKDIIRGGRRIGHNKKTLKTVRMLREGALVKNTVKGDIADISPITIDTNVFLRYGKAFLLPINNNWIPAL